MTKIMRTLWDESAELTDEAMRKYNKKRAIVFATLQMYRHDRMPYLRRILDDAKEKGFDSIVLVVETDTEQTYYINDTEDGFQCDEFDYYFEDLDSIAETLFNEKIIGKPVEIRIE